MPARQRMMEKRLRTALGIVVALVTVIPLAPEAKALESNGSVAIGPYVNALMRSTSGEYLFAVTYGTPSKIVTVRLSDFSVINTYTTSLNRVRGAAVGPSIPSDSVGTTEGIVLASDETPSKVVRVQVGAGGVPMSEGPAYTLSGSEGNASSVALDETGANAIIGSSGTKLLRLRLSDMARLDFAQLDGSAGVLRRVVQAPDRSLAYFSTYGGTSGRILKVRTSDMAVLAQSASIEPLYASGISADGAYGVFAGAGSPSILYRIRLSDWTGAGAYMLGSGVDNVHSIAVSSDGSYVYAGSHTRPSRLVEVRMSDGEQSNPIEFSKCCLISAVTDTTLDFAYFGTGENGTDELVRIPLKEAPTNSSRPGIAGGWWSVGDGVSTTRGGWSATPLPSFTYEWQRSSDGSTNWSTIDGETNARYVFTADDTAEYVRVRVTAANPYGNSSALSEATGPIQGPPIVRSAPTLSGTPNRGETISSTSGSWKAYPNPSFALRWQRSESGTSGWSDISGASGSTLTLRVEDAGYFVRSVSRATNARGSEEASSAALRVTGPPSIVVGPSVEGEGVAGRLLTAIRGTWRAWPDPTYSYQWQRSGDGGSWAPISGATLPTYIPTSSDIGMFIRVAVSARNSYGSAFSVSGATAPVIGDGSPPPPPPLDDCELAPPPPGGPLGISINAGARYTNQRQVVISMVWPSCKDRVVVSNDGGFGNAEVKTLEPSGRTSWLLDSTGAERLPKTVYVRFREPATRGGAESATFTDDIVLDLTAPAVRTAKLSRSTLKVSASDRTSGLASLETAIKTSRPSAPVAFKTAVRVRGSRPAYVRVTDRAGNRSKWVRIKR
jgi:hypothetical protein